MSISQSFTTYYPGYGQIQVSENLTWQVISAITNAFPMTVTTVNNHNYIAGMNVRFLIPGIFGMQQLNGINAQVLTASSNTMTVNIDSTLFTPFAYPAQLPAAYSAPTVIPNSSGPYLVPPLPYGNQDSFDGVIYNGGIV